MIFVMPIAFRTRKQYKFVMILLRSESRVHVGVLGLLLFCCVDGHLGHLDDLGWKNLMMR